MAEDIQTTYAERLNRYVTALRNEKPDRIPIRPFAAEFVATYAGYTCQEVTHDFGKAFEAARRCAADFDWDATVANMVYVWTGLTQAIGLKYYATPGLEIPVDRGFQYLEPSPEQAFMQPEEYDEFIDDPTSFLFNTWLPRVSTDVTEPGQPGSYRNNLSFLKGGMAMLDYFMAFGPQVEKLRTETGTVSAIAGILKAPFDILADKLRGYVGLCMDLFERPGKVLAACEALMPHLLHVAASTADPERNVPIGFWMHRGCVPFVSPEQFENLYWPTLRPIIEALWAQGHQVLFYAEGDWSAHLERIAELPDLSIVFHVDRSDLLEVHRVLGGKFCLSGGIPNYLLAHGTPDEVRSHCQQVIDAVAADGGYIMDASAIIQDDARIENIRAMSNFTRDYGVYGQAASTAAVEPAGIAFGGSKCAAPSLLEGSRTRPGVCLPWSEKRRELAEISGDEHIFRRVWEDIDALGYSYIWQCLLSF